MNEYNDTEIEVLEGLEAVRRRPKSWLASTDARELHPLVWQLLYNCLDKFDDGYCNTIGVTLNSDGSISVEDDGRGIETFISEHTGKSGVKILFTSLGCPSGLASAIVNALSERLVVDIFRDGRQYKARYQRGNSFPLLEVIGDTDKHGTRVTILPDKDAPNPFFDFDTLQIRLREIAFLNKTLRIDLADPPYNKRETFLFDSGISDYLSWLNHKQVKVNNVPLYFAGQWPLTQESALLNIECAFQWTDRKECLSLVFFNIDPVSEEFSIADINADLAIPLDDFARSNQLFSEHEFDISDIEISKGISTILSLKCARRLRWLDKQYLRNMIKDAVQNCFRQYLQLNKDDARSLIETLRNNRNNGSGE